MDHDNAVKILAAVPRTQHMLIAGGVQIQGERREGVTSKKFPYAEHCTSEKDGKGDCA